MGEARLKQYSRAVFLKQHPVCCYCGGVATTTDHCPPRSMFKRRVWPEGFEFPACERCNNAARRAEQFIACAFRVPFSTPHLEPEVQRLILGFRNNLPDVFTEWNSVGAARKKRLLREKFGELGNELYRAGYGVVEVGPKQAKVLAQFGDKLARALYFKHLDEVLHGRIFTRHLSFLNNQEYLDTAVSIAPIASETVRCTYDLGEQFSYRCNFSGQAGVFYAVVKLGEQQGYQLFAFSERGWKGLKEFDSDTTASFSQVATEAVPFGFE